MNSFNNLTKDENQFLKFIEIDSKELFKQKNNSYIKKILNKEIQGFIVKGLFNNHEISEVLKEIQSIPKRFFNEVIFGEIFPLPFAVMNNGEEGVAKYFESQNQYIHYSKKNKLCKLDKFIENAFSAIDKTIKKENLTDVYEKKEMTLATLRKFHPNKGGLHIHCGHSHQEVKFYNRLPSDLALQPQLSFFLVIQNSEKGGELTVYDLLWEKGQHKDNSESNEYILNKDNQKIMVKNLNSFKIKPNAGDLLVFAGGDIYHRVEQIEGNSDRITFGGFINFSKDLKTYYLWS